MIDLFPFTVRLHDGREWCGYAPGAIRAVILAQLALDGAVKLLANGSEANPAVLVIRANEPFLRNRSWLRRLVDRWVP